MNKNTKVFIDELCSIKPILIENSKITEPIEIRSLKPTKIKAKKKLNISSKTLSLLNRFK